MPGPFVLITGCSGGGKSTLCAALAARGFAVVPEPGRRIVEEEEAGDGAALPWVDPAAFARRALAMARADLAAAGPGPVFFDRGLVDAALALEHAAAVPLNQSLGRSRHYARAVFLAPPWPEIFARDAARRHGFAEAEAEFRRIERALPELGYRAVILPKTPVAERLALVLRKLRLA